MKQSPINRKQFWCNFCPYLLVAAIVFYIPEILETIEKIKALIAPVDANALPSNEKNTNIISCGIDPQTAYNGLSYFIILIGLIPMGSDRIHDTGHSQYWAFIPLVPIILLYATDIPSFELYMIYALRLSIIALILYCGFIPSKKIKCIAKA